MTEPNDPSHIGATIMACFEMLREVVPPEELTMLFLVQALKEFMTDKGKAPITPSQQLLAQTSSPEMIGVVLRPSIRAMQEQIDPFVAEMIPLMREEFEQALGITPSEPAS